MAISIDESAFLKAIFGAAPISSTSDSDKSGEKKKEKKIGDKSSLYSELDKTVVSAPAQESAFNKIEYTPMTDEEIESKANDLNDKIFGQKLQNYLDSYALKQQSTEAKKENAEKASLESAQKTAAVYDSSKKQAEEQALKRGLGRSSVIMGVLEKYDSQKNTQLSDVQRGLSESLSAIDGELLALESEKQKYIDNLEIDKAVAAAEKVETLKKERESKLAEVTKFNNDVTEKQLKYGESAAAAGSASMETLMQRGNTIIDFYNGVPAGEAFEDFVEDERFKEYLGNAYQYFYQKLKVAAGK